VKKFQENLFIENFFKEGLQISYLNCHPAKARGLQSGVSITALDQHLFQEYDVVDISFITFAPGPVGHM
jgi:hypothetical protein